MGKETENFLAPCENCERQTRHKMLCEHTEHGNEDYAYFISLGVIECLGCGANSFQKIFRDEENAYPTHNDEWEVPEERTYYPKFDLNHKVPDGMWNVPSLVHEIYSESLLAVKEGALTLAGLGLRGTIEAICNDRQITGRTLDVRISRMATQGLISSADAARLHGIRFLGNDAAHEIKKPKIDQIRVALKIIEHCIQSIYILDLEVAGKLDTLVWQLEELKQILIKQLKGFSAGEEHPLSKFLGQHTRRLGTNAAQLESQLMTEITNKTFSLLQIGKVATYAGSNQLLQHFIVS